WCFTHRFRWPAGRVILVVIPPKIPLTYFADLSPCTYFGNDSASSLVSVGWLTDMEAFDRGPTPPEAYAKLNGLIVDPWQPTVFLGVHHCALCQFDPPAGSANLFVPDGSRILVCPELILHYIAAHHYRPPTVFLDAVMACPNTRTMEFKKLLLQSGGRSLVRNAG
ncbi:MAG: hypothetical protein OSA98_19960, partial [Rubripirellula sp.]|nr:hypothetical protein [Rubripirellula sp.]